MTEEELEEIVQLLEAAGVNAQLCDTPVRIAGMSAVCGVPKEIGDENWDDYILLPKALVGLHPEMMIPTEGDSMVGANIEPGDSLRVRFGVMARDGDIVLAWIDGQCTVKTLYTDEVGQQWLVPQNEAYDAILLAEVQDARVLGVVMGVEKGTPRVSIRSMAQAVRRTESRRRAAQKLSDEAVDAIVAGMATEVVHARQWYAVYKAMVEYDVQDEGDYQGFCRRVARLLPDHRHLPDPRELARVCVLSFAKPIALWEESDAPVSGSRFHDYRRIALTMKSRLST